MCKRRHRPMELVPKLRQVDVLTSQGQAPAARAFPPVNGVRRARTCTAERPAGLGMDGLHWLAGGILMRQVVRIW